MDDNMPLSSTQLKQNNNEAHSSIMAASNSPPYLNNMRADFQLLKQFYKEIQNWYIWALNDNRVFFPYGHKDELLVKIIIQVLFIWFLKEKKLIPNDLFEEERLKNIIKDFGNSYNYYNAILQNLFYATLNIEIQDRKFVDSFDGHDNSSDRPDHIKEGGFKFKELLNEGSENDFMQLFLKIPFLNAGPLFEYLPSHHEQNFIDGFTLKEPYRAKIPDEFFFAHKQNPKSNTGVGLIQILKKYKFGLEDNNNAVLGPIVLGFVFENLLSLKEQIATISHTFKDTIRKTTGSYYTPPIIVEFMVEEALIAYFKKQTTIEHKKLEDIVAGDKNCHIDDHEKKQIVNAISKITVLDPAIGSGAFAIGVLNKLTQILEHVDPDNNLWKQCQYEKIANDRLDEGELVGALNQFCENDFDGRTKSLNYARKLYLIQNSIYGVDIQPMAVQITKLRLWLSLLAEQKPCHTDASNNFNIEPFINLEPNFVAANSLLNIKSDLINQMTPELLNIQNQLLNFYKKIARAIKSQEKGAIKQNIKNLKEKLHRALIEYGWQEEWAQKIIQFDVFNQTTVYDWFSPEWMFGINGFEIVIGNPPYVRHEKIDNDLKNLLRQNFGNLFNSTADLYVYFVFRGYELLRPDGILTYIISNKWMRAKYGKNLRRFLKDNTWIDLIVDLGGHKIFDNITVDTCIILVKKMKLKNPAIRVAVLK